MATIISTTRPLMQMRSILIPNRIALGNSIPIERESEEGQREEEEREGGRERGREKMRERERDGERRRWSVRA